MEGKSETKKTVRINTFLSSYYNEYQQNVQLHTPDCVLGENMLHNVYGPWGKYLTVSRSGIMQYAKKCV